MVVVLVFLLVVLGLVGWHGDWVLVYRGHSGCFGLGMELLGLMTLASKGIPLLVLGVYPVGSWLSLRELLCFLCGLVSFPLCWAACLRVADADVGSSHSLARLKLGAE